MQRPPSKRPVVVDASSRRSGRARFRAVRRRRPALIVGSVVAALAVLLVAATSLVFLFDWNRARPSLESLAERLLAREVTIGTIDVDWDRATPLAAHVRLRDLRIANPDWTAERTFATAALLEFPVTPRMLWAGVLGRTIWLPYVRVDAANLALERAADGRANWQFKPPDPDKPDAESRVQVQRLRIGTSTATYRDAVLDVTTDVRIETRNDPDWPTRADGRGTYRGAPLEISAATGELLSLRDAGDEFPLRFSLRADGSRLDVEGRVADIAGDARIDAQVQVAGPSLHLLYDTLKLALPVTPRYQLSGRLLKQGDRYTYENFSGTIGRTDLRGTGSFERREPRPLLVADLQSARLDLADLGPVIGTRPANGQTGARAKARADRKAAQARRQDPSRVLPSRPFSHERLNAIDAQVRLKAHDLRLPDRAPLSDFAATLKLDNGVLTIEPVEFGFAGGDILGAIRMDSSKTPLQASASIDFRRVQLSKLIPALEGKQASEGRVGARVRLRGRGASVAEMLGTSTGSVTLGMAGGTISQLATAAASLDGGKLLVTLLGGDKPTPIRCAGVALEVHDGVGTINQFVFDTEDVRFTAEGSVNLAEETLGLALRAAPKKPSLFSARAPVYVTGSFGDPSFGVDAGAIARGAAAAALSAVNPLAALLPLIEPGGGEDSNCREVLAPVSGAVREAGNRSSAPAAPPASNAEARKEARRAGASSEGVQAQRERRDGDDAQRADDRNEAPVRARPVQRTAPQAGDTDGSERRSETNRNRDDAAVGPHGKGP